MFPGNPNLFLFPGNPNLFLFPGNSKLFLFPGNILTYSCFLEILTDSCFLEIQINSCPLNNLTEQFPELFLSAWNKCNLKTLRWGIMVFTIVLLSTHLPVLGE